MKLPLGFLCIMLGAMPLNGYLGYLFDPNQFHRDHFIGTLWHLLAGMAPYLIGVTLIATSRAPAKLIVVCLLAFPAGILLTLPAVLSSKDHLPLISWLTLAVTGSAVGVVSQSLLAWKRPSHALQLTGDDRG